MSVRQRVYPSREQAAALTEHCHQARFMFNLALAQRSMWRRDKHVRGNVTVTSASLFDPNATFTNTSFGLPTITYLTQARQLTELRKDIPWLAAGSTIVQQGALRDLDRAFSKFFSGHASYPQFKKKSPRAGSFALQAVHVRRLNRRNAVVSIPKVGEVRFRVSGDWEEIAAAKSARVTLRHAQWHIAFTSPRRQRRNPMTHRPVGIDRGVTNTIATSDGHLANIPLLSEREANQFASLQRRIARTHGPTKANGATPGQRGSRRRDRLYDRAAKYHLMRSNRGRDWVEKTTTALAETYSLAVIERLPTHNMTRRATPRPDPAREGAFLPNGAHAKTALNRRINESRWSIFSTRLSHKMTVLAVDPRNTSRRCNPCGHVDKGSRKSQAVFSCVRCGHTAHADVNAARNILDLGVAEPLGTGDQQHKEPEGYRGIGRARSGASSRHLHAT